MTVYLRRLLVRLLRLLGWDIEYVCRWCVHGEEHHGVARALEARIEYLEIRLSRLRQYAVGNAPLMEEIDAALNGGD